MSLPFLKAESEENATQALAFIAVAILTVGLMVMNVSGAIAGSRGTSVLEMTIRIALAVILAGAELLAAVALVRVMLAPNRLRKIVGGMLFLGLAWACIQNGKRAVHLIYPEFEHSAALLLAQADIADTEADNLESARKDAVAARPAELANVRERISVLEAEQRLMASQSPEKIAEAQASLIAQGKYFWAVDGVRGPETEKAMRSRGEEIRQALEPLRIQEANLAAGVVVVAAPVATGEAALGPAERRAVLEDQASRATSAAIWLEVMLWVFEGARSLGLWVYVTTITSRKRTEQTRAASDEVPDGMVRRDLTPEEWAEYERAMEKHRNHAEGVKKGQTKKRQGNKVAQTREYEQSRVDRVRSLYGDGRDVHKIAKKMNLTTNQLRYELESYVTKGLMDSEEFIVLFGFAPSAKPERPAADDAINGWDAVMRGTAVRLDTEDEEPETPEPPQAVAESPQDETDIAPEETAIADPEPEPEPKEYGVALFEAPANEDDEDEPREAASV